MLLDERLRQEFLGSVGKSDAKAVKAFVSANAENALKTRPKVRLHSSLDRDDRAGWTLPRRCPRYPGGSKAAEDLEALDLATS